jgi:hypothetical protein
MMQALVLSPKHPSAQSLSGFGKKPFLPWPLPPACLPGGREGPGEGSFLRHVICGKALAALSIDGGFDRYSGLVTLHKNSAH